MCAQVAVQLISGAEFTEVKFTRNGRSIHNDVPEAEWAIGNTAQNS
jgi:hypothetical protein